VFWRHAEQQELPRTSLIRLSDQEDGRDCPPGITATGIAPFPFPFSLVMTRGKELKGSRQRGWE
jgi:hypothetical protein